MKLKQTLPAILASFLFLLGNKPLLAGTYLPSFDQYKNTAQKKKAFFRYLSPLAQQANKKVQQDRQRLFALKKKKAAHLSNVNTQWLQRIAERYNVKKQGTDAMLNALLIKVDIIPTALLLAQAANESAWGTSRFAKKGNNLFGQWCYRLNCGMVPMKRSKGQTHEVQTFDSPSDSIKAYLFNLNSNSHYQALRTLRANLHQQGKPITATALSQGLLHYSERGAAYVNDIKTMIRTNNLE